eukprot:755589-Hanusia_phi.AAC.1
MPGQCSHRREEDQASKCHQSDWQIRQQCRESSPEQDLSPQRPHGTTCLVKVVEIAQHNLSATTRSTEQNCQSWTLTPSGGRSAFSLSSLYVSFLLT